MPGFGLHLHFSLATGLSIETELGAGTFLGLRLDLSFGQVLESGWLLVDVGLCSELLEGVWV